MTKSVILFLVFILSPTQLLAQIEAKGLNVFYLDTISEEAIKRAGISERSPLYLGIRSAGMAAPTDNPTATREYLEKEYSRLEIQSKRHPDNKLIEHIVTDPKTGKKLTIAIDYNPKNAVSIIPPREPGKALITEETARGPRPEMDIFEYYKERDKRTRQAMWNYRKQKYQHHMKSFSVEAASFYYGVGLHAVYNLITESHQNPMALSQFRDMLKDPVAHVSFAAFVMANRATNKYTADLLQRAAFGEATPSMLSRTGKFLLPQLGMAMGGIASNVVHDVAILTKSCADAMLNAVKLKGEVTEEAYNTCEETKNYIFSSDKGYEYVTAISSLISSSIMLQGVTMGGAKLAQVIGSRVNLQAILLPFRSFANYIPMPQFKILSSSKYLKHIIPGLAQANLILFFELDEEIFYPVFHHATQKFLDSGPSSLKYYKELNRRLDTAIIQRLSEQDYDNYIAGYGYGAIPATLTGKDKNLDLVLFGRPDPTNRNLNWLQKSWNLLAAPFTSHRVYQRSLEVENESLADLFAEYEKHSQKWRSTLTSEFHNKYYSWLGKIAPFNASVQMTYEFYDSFFEELNTVADLKRPYSEINEKHSLYHEEVLDDLRMMDLSGNIISEENKSVLKVEAQETYQVNTLRHSLCLIDDLALQINEVQRDPKFAISVANSRHELASRKPLAVNTSKALVSSTLKQLDFLRRGLTCDTQLGEKLKNTPPDSFYTGARINNTNQHINEDEKNKIRSGLSYLNYAYHLIQNLNGAPEILKHRFAYLNHILSPYGSFMPHDRGEYFLKFMNFNFLSYDKEYAMTYENLPAHHILKSMACQTEPLIKDSSVWGSLKFNPPRITKEIPKELCARAFTPNSMDDLKYARDKIQHNLGLAEITDYVVKHAKQDIKNRNVWSWWLDNVENKVDDKFVELNKEYSRNITDFLLPQIFNTKKPFISTADTTAFGTENYRHQNFNSIPKSLNAAYKMSLDLYLAYLEKTYVSLSNDRHSSQAWHEMKTDLLQSFEVMLGTFSKRIDLQNQAYLEGNNQAVLDANQANNLELADSYGKVLAIYKKIKSLFIYKDPRALNNVRINDDDHEDLKATKESLQFYREALWPENPDLLAYEYLNALELRVRDGNDNDRYINDSFRKYLVRDATTGSSVAEKYMGLAPLVLREQYIGEGIEAIRTVLDNLMSTLEDAYRISEIANLTSHTIYDSTKIEEIEKKGKSSLWAK